MEVVELIKAWNGAKGIRHSWKGSDGRPTFLAKQLQDMIDKDGEEAVTKWVFKKMNDPQVPSDMNKIIGRSVEYLNFLNEQKKPAEQAAPQAQAMGGTQVLQILSQELIKMIGDDLAQNIEKKVDQYVAGKTLIKAVKVGDADAKPIKGVVHRKFETVLRHVAMDEPVMMVGPAGTGKNVIVKQVADSLGLNFYFTNAVTQEYKLTGFVDAMGNFQKTQFYDFCVNGGLFFLDEIDASVPEVLVILNAAIANRYFDFPKVGRVELNENCRFIAAANTYGTGASMEYSGRYQLDAASLNRFAVVKIDYDGKVEEACAGGNRDCLDFCRSFRKIAERNGLRVVVSYREIGRLHKMVDVAGLGVTEAIECDVVKGLETDSIRMIHDAMPDSIAWKKNLGELI